MAWQQKAARPTGGRGTRAQSQELLLPHNLGYLCTGLAQLQGDGLADSLGRASHNADLACGCNQPAPGPVSLRSPFGRCFGAAASLAEVRNDRVWDQMPAIKKADVGSRAAASATTCTLARRDGVLGFLERQARCRGAAGRSSRGTGREAWMAVTPANGGSQEGGESVNSAIVWTETRKMEYEDGGSLLVRSS